MTKEFDVNGVWIVVKRDKNLLLYRFNDVLRKPKDWATINVENFPTGPQIGPDGEEVVLTHGALLHVQRITDKANRSLLFHMANVGPSNDTTQRQYQYVLGKLGLAEPSVLPSGLRKLDGQFRKLCDDIAKGHVKSN